MTIETIVENRVKEFEDSYEGILPQEYIEKGAQWYRNALTSAIIEALEGVVPPSRLKNLYSQTWLAGFETCRQALLEKIEALKKV